MENKTNDHHQKKQTAKQVPKPIPKLWNEAASPFQGTLPLNLPSWKRHVPPPVVFLRGQVCLVCDLIKGLGLCKGTDCHVCTQSNFQTHLQKFFWFLSPPVEYQHRGLVCFSSILDAKKNCMFCHKIKATTASILVLCFESMQIPTVLIYWMLVRSAAQDLY